MMVGLSRFILLLLFTSCAAYKVTNIVETTDGGAIYYIYDRKIDRWQTIVDSSRTRFEIGQKFNVEEFENLEK
jgi:hypothetical protein